MNAKIAEPAKPNLRPAGRFPDFPQYECRDEYAFVIAVLEALEIGRPRTFSCYSRNRQPRLRTFYATDLIAPFEQAPLFVGGIRSLALSDYLANTAWRCACDARRSKSKTVL